MMHMRVEALVRLAKAKLEIGDVAHALQILEGASPHVTASGSSKLHAEALAAQADILLQLTTSHCKDEATRMRLLREVVTLLSCAVEECEKVAELSHLRRCLYLLARTCHEVGDIAKRDVYSAKFRRVCDFFNGRKHLDDSPKSALHIMMLPCNATSVKAHLGSGHSEVQPAPSPLQPGYLGCDHSGLQRAPSPAQPGPGLGSRGIQPLEHLLDLISISGHKKDVSLIQSPSSYSSNGLRALYPLSTVLNARA